jgi:hypothetical protein
MGGIKSFAASALMMETDEIETSVFSSIWTGLIAREDFSAFIRRESFKSFLSYTGARARSMPILFSILTYRLSQMRLPTSASRRNALQRRF